MRDPKLAHILVVFIELRQLFQFIIYFIQQAV